MFCAIAQLKKQSRFCSGGFNSMERLRRAKGGRTRTIQRVTKERYGNAANN
jgi:hypothetical protein